MRLTTVQYQELLARTQRNRVREPSPSSGEAKEMDLHQKIINYCDSQWPRWKYIRARSDRASTIAVGSQDFTVFLPDGRVLCIECKARGGKLSEDQIIWAKEMEMLGHAVHLVRSMDEFLQLINQNKKRIGGIEALPVKQKPR